MSELILSQSVAEISAVYFLYVIQVLFVDTESLEISIWILNFDVVVGEISVKFC